MRKFLISLFSTIFLVCLAAFITTPPFSASAETNENNVLVDTFLPSSALQLYDLKSPMSISYSDNGFMVITEHIGEVDGSSLFDRISVYNPNTRTFTALNSHPTIYNITHAEEYNGYVFYLSSSKLYYVPTSNLEQEPIYSGVTSSNFFMIKNGNVITNTNNSIVIYSISEVDGNLVFHEKSTHNFTTKNAFISNDNNIYYLFGGMLYCFNTSSQTNYIVSEILVDVNYMIECGDYIYLSSGSGVYKIQKGVNSKAEQILSTQNAKQELGYVQNPQGLTVMDRQILIADPTIKCVQGIDSETNEFTDFAITTESTAEFRLTNNTSKISSSSNYVYALDDGAQDENGISYKRIVRAAIDKSVKKRYTSISLQPLYIDNLSIEIKDIACSDTHVAIHYNNTFAIFEIIDNTIDEVYSIISESITAICYIDGEFYYTDSALVDFTYSSVNIHKITLPTVDNNLQEIVSKKINENAEIKGVAKNFTVDVFGNVYLIVDETLESTDLNSQQLVEFSNGNVKVIDSFPYEITSLRTDFAGNLYGLSYDNVIYKYTYVLQEISTYKFDTSYEIKDFDLNYTSSTSYLLTNSAIFKTIDNKLQIINMSEVNSLSFNPLEIIEPKFISISDDAKLFKVTLGDYDDNKNFNSVTPIRNPNAKKVYLIIAEIDNYYLITHSKDFAALVRKTEVMFNPNVTTSSSIIGEDYYDYFNIKIETLSSEKQYISNSVLVSSKPIFDNNYMVSNLEKSAAVYGLKKITFNGKSFTLIATDEDKTPIGYVPSGYLTNEIISATTTTSNEVKIVDENADKHFSNVLMILLIAFTITATTLFVEKKLLFDKENGNIQK